MRHCTRKPSDINLTTLPLHIEQLTSLQQWEEISRGLGHSFKIWIIFHKRLYTAFPQIFLQDLVILTSRPENYAFEKRWLQHCYSNIFPWPRCYFSDLRINNTSSLKIILQFETSKFQKRIIHCWQLVKLWALTR